MRRVPALALRAACLVLACVAPPLAAAKDPKEPAVKPQPGLSKLPVPAPLQYVHMAVPADYDPKKWYPLVFLLHSLSDDAENSKPEIFVAPWAEHLLKRGWIIAGPKAPEYDNETTAAPLADALKRVMSVYRVDDRRVVLVGHNAGGCMAWNLATRYPKAFAGVMSFSGEVRQENRAGLKALGGKKAFVFRGKKDRYYTPAMLAEDRKHLEANKLDLTVFEKDDWEQAMPVHDMARLVEWVESVGPPGGWKERGDAIEKAVAAGEWAAAAKAIADAAAEVKKAPYPAFEERLAALSARLTAGLADALAAITKEAEADPLGAVGKADAAVKALKGVKGLEETAKKAQAALLRLPAVAEAVKKKEAEEAGSAYMEKAAAAEAKGDLAQALAAYRKAAALALFPRKDEAAAKVAELEPKVGAK